MFARLKALLVAAVPSRGDLGAVLAVVGAYALWGGAVAALVAAGLLIGSEVAS